MSSPTLTNEQLTKEYGKRDLPPGAVAFDQPQELGYICPKGHGGDWLAWSEFNDHIWCYECEKDYHYATDCLLKRMCWMNDEQWLDFSGRLPIRPQIIKGIQHFPDCKVPHNSPTHKGGE